jgi:hypothetical protein
MKQCSGAMQSHEKHVVDHRYSAIVCFVTVFQTVLLFQDLLLLEEQEGSVNFKFGVLYTRPGQNSDDEMFSNGKCSYRLSKLQSRRIEHLLKLFGTINILSFVCKCKVVPQVAGEHLTKGLQLLHHQPSVMCTIIQTPQLPSSWYCTD